MAFFGLKRQKVRVGVRVNGRVRTRTAAYHVAIGPMSLLVVEQYSVLSHLSTPYGSFFVPVLHSSVEIDSFSNP